MKILVGLQIAKPVGYDVYLIGRDGKIYRGFLLFINLFDNKASTKLTYASQLLITSVESEKNQLMKYWTQEEVSLKLLDCSQIVNGEVCIKLATFKEMVFDPQYPPDMFDESIEVIKDLEQKMNLKAS